LATALILIALVLCAILVAGFLCGRYFYNFALNRYTIEGKIFKAPHNKVDSPGKDKQRQRREENEAWLHETGYQTASIRSDDDLQLFAHEIRHPQPADKWAIVLHGYTARGLAMLEAVRHFYDMGFDILLPDARGHGESEGDYVGMGWHDRLDVLRWMAHIMKNAPDADILVYGISMGGACAMMTSGETLPQNVKAFIEDCGYASVKDEFAYQGKRLFKWLPAFPLINFASAYTKYKAGYSFGEANAEKQVAKSKTPTLFIHGADDTFVPACMLDRVFQAANCPKERILVEGAGHSGSHLVLGDAYWAKIRAFLSPYFGGITI
jgi:alpha-beta hydrolase superfamily lysophospholipase